MRPNFHYFILQYVQALCHKRQVQVAKSESYIYGLGLVQKLFNSDTL